jgi:Zn-dependent protease
VSPTIQELNRTCSRCTNTLSPSALVCDKCHALVHADKLEQLAASARMFEQHDQLAQARSAWEQALPLLPSESSQAEWIRDKLKKLAIINAPSTPPSEQRHPWVQKLGPLAPIALVLGKSKFLLSLFKLKFLLSFGTFLGFYWTLYGAKFGLGFALLILVHEMGHFIDIKLRGLPADMPVFLPGLGAYVRWAALGVSSRTRAFVSLAGPLAGWLGAAVCGLLWWKTGSIFWAGLASITAMLNLLNLIPIWILDGGQAIAALNKNERIALITAAVLFAVLFSEGIFLLVAGGAGYRLFTKDIPEEPSRGATLYYLALMAALGFLLKVVPARGA